MIAALTCHELQVFYPKNPRPALDHASLTVPAGSIVGLLGPNGAGKSTLLKCALGLLKPQMGQAFLFGEPWQNITSETERLRLRRVGVLLENPGFYRKMNTAEYLRFFGEFYGVKDIEARIISLASFLDLRLDKKPATQLSQGNRRKLHLARSLLHSPDFLVWDEPTEYLDPETQEAVLSVLSRDCKERGTSALLASHRLDQMEKVCSHVAFIANGRIHLCGSKSEVLGGVKAVEIQWQADGELATYPADAFENQGLGSFSSSLPVGELIAEAQGGVRLTELGVVKAPDMVAVLCHRGYRILSVTQKKNNLEQRYRELMSNVYGAQIIKPEYQL